MNDEQDRSSRPGTTAPRPATAGGTGVRSAMDDMSELDAVLLQIEVLAQAKLAQPAQSDDSEEWDTLELPDSTVAASDADHPVVQASDGKRGAEDGATAEVADATSDIDDALHEGDPAQGIDEHPPAEPDISADPVADTAPLAVLHGDAPHDDTAAPDEVHNVSAEPRSTTPEDDTDDADAPGSGGHDEAAELAAAPAAVAAALRAPSNDDTPPGTVADARVGLPERVAAPLVLPARDWISSAWDIAALLALFAVAIIAALTFRDYGLGWDDYTHSEYGELLRRYYASGLRDQSALSFVNLYYYGGGFDLAAALLAKISPFTLFETRRLAGAIAGILALAITWRLGRRLGGPSGGFFALVVLAATPEFYGHMFMNPKDVPFALAMALMLLGFMRMFEDYPRLSFGTILILGIGAGLAVGTRVMAGFWIVTAAIAFIPLLRSDMRLHGARGLLRLGNTVLRIMPAIVIAVAVMVLVWPWVATAPDNLIKAIAYFDVFFEKPWPEIFNGVVTPVPQMPWTYLPLLFGLKLPEGALALLGFGTLGIVIALLRRTIEPRRKAILLLILLAALLPLIVAMISRPALYNGIRHFIFVLPAMAAIAGLCAAWVIGHARRAGGFGVMVMAALMLAPFALPVMAMQRLHPFEYAYFNDASGGVRAAEGRFMIDYWGLSFKQASDELRALLNKRGESAPIGRRWKVALCGPTRAAEVALGPSFVAGSDTRNADFAITLGEFYCKDPALPVSASVSRDGHVFARIFDIRGVPVETLDRYPPVRAPAKP